MATAVGFPVVLLPKEKPVEAVVVVGAGVAPPAPKERPEDEVVVVAAGVPVFPNEKPLMGLEYICKIEFRGYTVCFQMLITSLKCFLDKISAYALTFGNTMYTKFTIIF